MHRSVPAYILAAYLPTARPTAQLLVTRRPHQLVLSRRIAMEHSSGLRRRHQQSNASVNPPASSTPDSRKSNSSSSLGIPDPNPLPLSIRGPLVAIPALLSLSALVLSHIEGWTLVDSLYFATVVCTTVGYGDLVPATSAGKLFVSAYSLISVALVGGLLSSLVDRFALAQQAVGRRLRERILSAPTPGEECSEQLEPELVRFAKKAYEEARARFVATAVFVGVIVALGVDTIWLTVITATTVGLGDASPQTPIGRAFATIWLIVLAIGFANIVGQHAELSVMQREIDLTTKLMSSEMSDRTFNAIDTSKDGLISREEYICYMLCKLGKTTTEELSAIRARFQELDSDNSGTVTRQEVMR
jgi:potassium channel subfamily K, other eukaryote